MGLWGLTDLEQLPQGIPTSWRLARTVPSAQSTRNAWGQAGPCWQQTNQVKMMISPGAADGSSLLMVSKGSCALKFPHSRHSWMQADFPQELCEGDVSSRTPEETDSSSEEAKAPRNRQHQHQLWSILCPCVWRCLVD